MSATKPADNPVNARRREFPLSAPARFLPFPQGFWPIRRSRWSSWSSSRPRPSWPWPTLRWPTCRRTPWRPSCRSPAWRPSRLCASSRPWWPSYPRPSSWFSSLACSCTCALRSRVAARRRRRNLRVATVTQERCGRRNIAHRFRPGSRNSIDSSERFRAAENARGARMWAIQAAMVSASNRRNQPMLLFAA